MRAHLVGVDRQEVEQRVAGGGARGDLDLGRLRQVRPGKRQLGVDQGNRGVEAGHDGRDAEGTGQDRVGDAVARVGEHLHAEQAGEVGGLELGNTDRGVDRLRTRILELDAHADLRVQHERRGLEVDAQEAHAPGTGDVAVHAQVADAQRVDIARARRDEETLGVGPETEVKTHIGSDVESAGQLDLATEHVGAQVEVDDPGQLAVDDLDAEEQVRRAVTVAIAGAERDVARDGIQVVQGLPQRGSRGDRTARADLAKVQPARFEDAQQQRGRVVDLNLARASHLGHGEERQVLRPHAIHEQPVQGPGQGLTIQAGEVEALEDLAEPVLQGRRKVEQACRDHFDGLGDRDNVGRGLHPGPAHLLHARLAEAIDDGDLLGARARGAAGDDAGIVGDQNAGSRRAAQLDLVGSRAARDRNATGDADGATRRINHDAVVAPEAVDGDRLDRGERYAQARSGRLCLSIDVQEDIQQPRTRRIALELDDVVPARAVQGEVRRLGEGLAGVRQDPGPAPKGADQNHVIGAVDPVDGGDHRIRDARAVFDPVAIGDAAEQSALAPDEQHTGRAQLLDGDALQVLRARQGEQVGGELGPAPRAEVRLGAVSTEPHPALGVEGVNLPPVVGIHRGRDHRDAGAGGSGEAGDCTQWRVDARTGLPNPQAVRVGRNGGRVSRRVGADEDEIGTVLETADAIRLAPAIQQRIDLPDVGSLGGREVACRGRHGDRVAVQQREVAAVVDRLVDAVGADQQGVRVDLVQRKGLDELHRGVEHGPRRVGKQVAAAGAGDDQARLDLRERARGIGLRELVRAQADLQVAADRGDRNDPESQLLLRQEHEVADQHGRAGGHQEGARVGGDRRRERGREGKAAEAVAAVVDGGTGGLHVGAVALPDGVPGWRTAGGLDGDADVLRAADDAVVDRVVSDRIELGQAQSRVQGLPGLGGLAGVQQAVDAAVVCLEDVATDEHHGARVGVGRRAEQRTRAVRIGGLVVGDRLPLAGQRLGCVAAEQPAGEVRGAERVREVRLPATPAGLPIAADVDDLGIRRVSHHREVGAALATNVDAEEARAFGGPWQGHRGPGRPVVRRSEDAGQALPADRQRRACGSRREGAADVHLTAAVGLVDDRGDLKRLVRIDPVGDRDGVAGLQQRAGRDAEVVGAGGDRRDRLVRDGADDRGVDRAVASARVRRRAHGELDAQRGRQTRDPGVHRVPVLATVVAEVDPPARHAGEHARGIERIDDQVSDGAGRKGLVGLVDGAVAVVVDAVRRLVDAGGTQVGEIGTAIGAAE